MNPQQFFQLLKNSNFLKSQGSITLNFNEISVKANFKDCVGTLIQEWILEWARVNNIHQLFPNT